MCLGVPGKIVAITDRERQMAQVDIGGVSREVCLACLVESEEELMLLVGCWVLVHVGFALNLIAPDEAEKTLALLTKLDSDALP